MPASPKTLASDEGLLREILRHSGPKTLWASASHARPPQRHLKLPLAERPTVTLSPPVGSAALLGVRLRCPRLSPNPVSHAQLDLHHRRRAALGHSPRRRHPRHPQTPPRRPRRPPRPLQARLPQVRLGHHQPAARRELLFPSILRASTCLKKQEQPAPRPRPEARHHRPP